MTSTDFVGWVSTLARAHTASLVRTAVREGLDAEDALDAAQEAFHTFLLLPQARALAREGDEARRLLAVLVRSAARNLRRRHHRSMPHEPLGEGAELAAGEPPVDELLERAEAHVRFAGCVDRLAELQRRVVTLRMLDEVSGLEAARLLDLAPGRVAVLLHRARSALRACLEA